MPASMGISRGASITFTAPATGASGTFSGTGTGAQAASNASGVATAPTFTAINGAFAAQLNAQDLGDMAPNAPMLARYAGTCRELASVVGAWQRLSTTDLGALNMLLTNKG